MVGDSDLDDFPWIAEPLSVTLTPLNNGIIQTYEPMSKPGDEKISRWIIYADRTKIILVQF
jgi:hypothetical protein